jgi:lysophospholipase L1-like esterase
LRSFVFCGSAASLAAFLACSSSSDGGGGGGTDDGSVPSADGSTPGKDGSTTPGKDSGTPGTDSGTPGKDSGTTNQDAGPPGPRYVGRTTVTGPDVQCNWSGCRAMAKFHGTAASISIGSSGGPSSSNYDVIVDGVVTKQIVVNSTTAAAPFVLASGLPLADHTVEVYKRSEANDGIETFHGFTFPNGGTVLSPPLPGKHTIEFIGDSITAGFGVEGAGANCDVSPLIDTLTNVHKSFAGVTAGNLGADATFIAFSGKGVTRNFDTGDTQLLFGNAMGTQDLYDVTKVDDTTATWGFKPVPDAVVIALGADDFNNPGNGTPPTAVAFQAAYKAFLVHIRAKYATSYIFATYSPSTVDVPPAENAGLTICKAAIPAAVTSLADAKIFYVNTVPDAVPSDATGCLQHPNAAYHAVVATALTTFIKSKTGW